MSGAVPLLDYPLPVLGFFAGAVAAGGLVKGIAGFGMPMVAVSLVASVTGPAQAIALLAVPNIGSNVLQALHSGHYREMFLRFWPALLPLVIVTVMAAQILTKIDVATASWSLGLVVLAFVAVQSARLPIAGAIKTREAWLSPLVGCVSGFLGGISSFFGPPVTMYLIALRLPKEHFISATALFFAVGGVPLYATLALNGILDGAAFAASILAVGPTFVGFFCGRILARRIPQRVFDKLILVVLTAIGLNLLRRGLA